MAVGLALVALIGVIGPVLVFRHRRSEQYKAIVAVNALQTHYVAKSWRTMFLIKIGVPALKEPPSMEKTTLSVSVLAEEISSTGWVKGFLCDKARPFPKEFWLPSPRPLMD
jgi:hypothetical protein